MEIETLVTVIVVKIAPTKRGIKGLKSPNACKSKNIFSFPINTTATPIKTPIIGPITVLVT